MNTDPRIIPPGEVLPPMDLGERLARRNGQSTGTHGPKPKPKRSAGKRGSAVRRRFGLLNAFLDRALPDLRRSDIAAWLLLYRHAKPDGTAAASVGDLARRAGCCDRAMRYALGRLQSAGLVERIKRGTLAGGPSVWRLLTPEGGGA